MSIVLDTFFATYIFIHILFFLFHCLLFAIYHHTANMLFSLRFTLTMTLNKTKKKIIQVFIYTIGYYFITQVKIFEKILCKSIVKTHNIRILKRGAFTKPAIVDLCFNRKLSFFHCTIMFITSYMYLVMEWIVCWVEGFSRNFNVKLWGWMLNK